jgi:hypothetical protein
MVITLDGVAHAYDSFECAIQGLAPQCEHCGVRILGHGVECEDRIFCGASCARSAGVPGLVDHA